LGALIPDSLDVETATRRRSALRKLESPSVENAWVRLPPACTPVMNLERVRLEKAGKAATLLCQRHSIADFRHGNPEPIYVTP
jgi:hypothetical protein